MMSSHSLLIKIADTIEQGKRMIPINKAQAIRQFNIAIESLNSLKKRNLDYNYILLGDQDIYVSQRIEMLLISANQAIEYTNAYSINNVYILNRTNTSSTSLLSSCTSI